MLVELTPTSPSPISSSRPHPHPSYLTHHQAVLPYLPDPRVTASEMGDDMSRVAVYPDGTPVPIDPRLAALSEYQHQPTPTRQPPPSYAWMPQLPGHASPYASTPHDASFPHRPSTSSYPPLSDHSSAQTYASTPYNISSSYYSSTSSYVSRPHDSSSSSFGPTTGDASSPYNTSSYVSMPDDFSSSSYGPRHHDASLSYHPSTPPFASLQDVTSLRGNGSVSSASYSPLMNQAHGSAAGQSEPSYAFSPSNGPEHSVLAPSCASTPARPPPPPGYEPAQTTSYSHVPNESGATDLEWVRDPTLVVHGAKVYTSLCGIVIPSKLPPGEAPKQSGLDRPTDPFHCPICDCKFDRYHSVKSHFPSCVKRNGNPEGKYWLDHPSLRGWRGPRNNHSLYFLNRDEFYARRGTAPPTPRRRAVNPVESPRRPKRRVPPEVGSQETEPTIFSATEQEQSLPSGRVLKAYKYTLEPADPKTPLPTSYGIPAAQSMVNRYANFKTKIRFEAPKITADLRQWKRHRLKYTRLPG